jgi:hypothetical protein
MASITEVKATDLETAKDVLVPEAIEALRESLSKGDPDTKRETAFGILEFYGYRRKDQPKVDNNFLSLPSEALSGVLEGIRNLRTIASHDVEVEVIDANSDEEDSALG